MVYKLLKNNVYYILLKRFVQIYDELYTLKNPRGFRFPRVLVIDTVSTGYTSLGWLISHVLRSELEPKQYPGRLVSTLECCIGFAKNVNIE